MLQDSVQLTVRKNRAGPVLGRHPWVFAGAIDCIPEGLATGQHVRLVTSDGRYLASGLFNGYSQITVRVWSWEDEHPDLAFFERRIRSALEFRRAAISSPETDSYRLIFSENDLIPGLVVDRYADYLCLQLHNRAIEAWKDLIVEALVNVVKPKGIYERSDVTVRQREGAESRQGPLVGEIPEAVTIRENGHRFLVDLVHGQKTGFFLDQRDKRLAAARWAAGRRVLNCFCYTGGFSIYAGARGAAHVASVDASSRALDIARENVRLNGLDERLFTWECADAKGFLDQLVHAGTPSPCDMIILDPPAFIKDRRKIKEGQVGYRRINEAAFRLLPKDGILVTSSCSAHLSLEDFRYLLSESAARAGRTVQVLENHAHGADHPELVPFTECRYLKCLILRVL